MVMLGRHLRALYKFQGKGWLNMLGVAQGQMVFGGCSITAGLLCQQFRDRYYSGLGKPKSWVFQAGWQLGPQQRNH